MPAVSLCPTAGVFFQAFTVGGLPLNAGLLYTYIAGGTTPQSTYTTSAGNVANANPIVLGADGRPPNEVWLVNGASYRFDLYDSASNLIKSYDNVYGLASSISGTYLPTSGGTMSGNIAMGGNKITGLAAATANGDAVRYEQSPAAILTQKGALISASAANTPAVLVVGTNGQGLVSNSNATNGIQWAYPAMQKYIAGLTYANNSGDATNDLDIAAGMATDATGVSLMVLAAAITKQSDVNWAVGTNAGMLDTGAVGNNDYYLWLIQRVDTGVGDVLCSLSSTSPTMPANYTLKRIFGWFKRSGGSIVAFTTYEVDGGGLEFLWSVPTLDINLVNTLTTTRRTDSVKTPQNFSTTALLSVVINDASATQNWICCPDQTDAAPSATVAPLANVNCLTGEARATQLRIRTSSTGTIAARSNTATVDLYNVATMGFRWGRRN